MKTTSEWLLEVFPLWSFLAIALIIGVGGFLWVFDYCTWRVVYPSSVLRVTSCRPIARKLATQPTDSLKSDPDCSFVVEKLMFGFLWIKATARAVYLEWEAGGGVRYVKYNKLEFDSFESAHKFITSHYYTKQGSSLK